MPTKYRLTRDDGVALDVHDGLWESVLEIAYRNGWKPAGTEPPPTSAWRNGSAESGGEVREIGNRQWPQGDYFSARQQRVTCGDASAFGAAVLRGLPRHAAAADAAGRRHDGDERRVAAFASRGGFVIGRTPAVERVPD